MPLDVVIALATALVVVLLLHRVRVPTIAGFLIAGALVGPSGLGWISDTERIEHLAEIGVALLLFTIGLEFSLSKLRRIARAVLVGGGLQVGLTTAATVLLLLALGQTFERGLFFGFLVALSSTAIVLNGLSERGEIDAPHGQLIVGILLFQDLCVVPMMLIVPMLAAGDAGIGPILGALGLAVLVMAATVVLARYVVPPLFARVASTHRRDLFLLAVVLAGAGIAWATAQVGLSLALGAFLAGVVLADSEYGHQALSDVLPLRDLFTSLFFVSLGMLLDAGAMARDPVAVLLLSSGLLVGKLLLILVAGLVLRVPLRVALLAGLGLAQVGEFSFVLAALGGEEGLLSLTERTLFLNASVLTMLITPLLLRVGPHLAAGARRLKRIERAFGYRVLGTPSSRVPLEGHVVVLGHGVGGAALTTALREAGITSVVVDLDLDRVRASVDAGHLAFYGDASSPEILERVHVAQAAQVAVLLNDPDATLRAVRAVRQLAPQVPVIARARHLADVPRLEAGGATRAVAQEVEASLEVVEQVLARAGLEPARAEAIVASERDRLCKRPESAADDA